MYDVIIIGAGPAGLTSAIYSTRYNLKTLIIGEMIGGQTTEVAKIENYPGLPGVAGYELGEKILEQAKNLGAEFVAGKVEEVKKVGEQFEVTVTNGQKFEAKTVILAIGTEPKRLDVPGELELRGKGVSYCVTCDGPLYKGKTVAVIGGGDSAVVGAIDLAKYAAKVYLIHRRTEFRAKPTYVSQLSLLPQLTLLTLNEVTSINGETKLQNITLKTPYQNSPLLSVDGLFVEIGSTPNQRLTEQLGLQVDEAGFVKVDEDLATSVPGIFAAGDLTTGSKKMRQIVTALGEGAMAAESAHRHMQALEMGGV